MISVREATKSDSEAIIDFQIKMAWETEYLKLDREKVTHGVNTVFNNPMKGKYYVAESDSKVVASLLITYEWSDWRNANVWWLQSVYVVPEHRRMGIFRTMYGFVKDAAVKQNAAGLRLYVEPNNKAARKTYEALGMKSEHYIMYEWLRDSL
ncbi:MAG: GNAT family N-acetyltransferase [Bacteroidales bacterium]